MHDMAQQLFQANDKENTVAVHHWPSVRWIHWSSPRGFPSQTSLMGNPFQCHNILVCVCVFSPQVPRPLSESFTYQLNRTWGHAVSIPVYFKTYIVQLLKSHVFIYKLYSRIWLRINVSTLSMATIWLQQWHIDVLMQKTHINPVR